MQVTGEDIVAVIQQAKVVDAANDLRFDINLTDQGIDSLDLFSVFLALQEKYTIEIPDADLDNLNTIDEMVRYFNTRLS